MDVNKHKKLLITACDTVNQFCIPLAKLYVKLFNYVCVYPNGERVTLCSSANWNKYYFLNELYETPFLGCYDFPENIQKNELMLLTPGINLTPKAYQALQHFSLGHGLILITKTSEKLEYCFFMSNRADNSIINFFVNNMNAYKAFRLYFVNHCQNLIKQAHKTRLHIPLPYEYFQQTNNIISPITTSSRSVLDYYQSIKLTNPLVDKSANLNFSRRELQCINSILKGKSAREIGEMLGISRRTVEYYIENVKLKLECKKKSELVQKLLSMGYLLEGY